LVKLFREKLAQRGARGIIGLGRVFSVMDDNKSGSLDIQEFWKGLSDFRLPISPDECRQLFTIFDFDDCGEVIYNEFLRAVAGEMSPIRREFCMKAFQKCDKDNSGELELSDIKGLYNAKMHPDVKSGKKTEDEVLLEFLDTFEVHHALKNPEDRDGKVTQKEFLEYYNNISASIDDDNYFELMITNAWNLNDNNYSKGWGNAI
jgi:Ca2+-binding EF-hand superfamily protein